MSAAEKNSKCCSLGVSCALGEMFGEIDDYFNFFKMIWPEKVICWFGSSRLRYPVRSLSKLKCLLEQLLVEQVSTIFAPILCFSPNYLPDDSWLQLRDSRTRSCNPNLVPFWDHVSGVLGKALNEIWGFASRDVTPGIFLKELSEYILTFGAESSRKKVSEVIFGFWSEKVSVDFHEAGMTCWSWSWLITLIHHSITY